MQRKQNGEQVQAGANFGAVIQGGGCTGAVGRAHIHRYLLRAQPPGGGYGRLEKGGGTRIRDVYGGEWKTSLGRPGWGRAQLADGGSRKVAIALDC